MKNPFNFDSSYRQLPAHFYCDQEAENFPQLELAVFNEDLAQSVGLAVSGLSEHEKALIFAGQKTFETPLSQAYAGHQFGHFTMLGDGRALLLGEQITPTGERVDIQLKGSGRTPFSRRGDGKAALGPMLREYIIAEAMHALKIPTTRSLCVVKSSKNIIRESYETSAILARVASSHIRVGSFEFANISGGKSSVKALLDYTIHRHYPTLSQDENPALSLLYAAMERQADLMVHWMRVGFIHGVMNSDNMTLSGETIDYGPCAFMDHYHPQACYSSIDQQRRYSYNNQPYIAQWNLARFAETLIDLIDEDRDKAIEQAGNAVDHFATLYADKFIAMMRRKLGFFGQEGSDGELIKGFLTLLQKQKMDFTNSFRALGQSSLPDDPAFHSEDFQSWYQAWRGRLARNSKPVESSLCLMRANNPAVIPRNHKVEEALSAAQEGDFAPLVTLTEVLKEAYRERNAIAEFQTPPSLEQNLSYRTFCGT